MENGPNDVDGGLIRGTKTGTDEFEKDESSVGRYGHQ